MDKLSQESRSWNMSRIKSKDTAPELCIRSWLHRAGYRFRLHVKALPGTPDIVLPKYKTIIEVRGCYWHRHPGCKYAYTPKSNLDFWNAKFSENVTRDAQNDDAIKKMGWQLIIMWECQIKQILATDMLSRLIQKEMRYV